MGHPQAFPRGLSFSHRRCPLKPKHGFNGAPSGFSAGPVVLTPALPTQAKTGLEWGTLRLFPRGLSFPRRRCPLKPKHGLHGAPSGFSRGAWRSHTGLPTQAKTGLSWGTLRLFPRGLAFSHRLAHSGQNRACMGHPQACSAGPVVLTRIPAYPLGYTLQAILRRLSV
jgi:hypothetical protein